VATTYLRTIDLSYIHYFDSIHRFGAFVMLIGPFSASWRFLHLHLKRISEPYLSRHLDSMRRIPRPSRAIDPSVPPLQSSVRPRLPLPCTHLCASTAAFSTTPSNAFLLPGKQDKKKHQQFVRRWQKRLLGDSEPIGAHVDPYDPTSPVRIAPEEQGEYEEVLEDVGPRNANARKNVYSHLASRPGDLERRNKAALERQKYVPAEKGSSERPGQDLLHVGGDKWLQQKLEKEMAKEFEKLTMQTYTPLSLDMADDIETMTGTPYTLRDDNLMMAQTVHQVTNRPYTKYQ
jgi:hypothetical protein